MNRIQGIEHIEKLEDNPIMRDIIAGCTKFTTQILNFYDLSAHEGYQARFGGGGWYYTIFSALESDSSKFGRTPEDLLKIVGGCTARKFNANLFSYEQVREDLTRQEYFLETIKLFNPFARFKPKEFVRLYNGAKEIDEFIVSVYREHYVKRTLTQQQK